MPKIKKLNILSFAFFQALLCGLIGVVAGILYSFGGALVDLLVTLGWVTTTETPGLSYGTALAFLALLGMPAIAAGCGFLLGIVEAILYNIVARWFGGVKVNLGQEK